MTDLSLSGMNALEKENRELERQNKEFAVATAEAGDKYLEATTENQRLNRQLEEARQKEEECASNHDMTVLNAEYVEKLRELGKIHEKELKDRSTEFEGEIARLNESHQKDKKKSSQRKKKCKLLKEKNEKTLQEYMSFSQSKEQTIREMREEAKDAVKKLKTSLEDVTAERDKIKRELSSLSADNRTVREEASRLSAENARLLARLNSQEKASSPQKTKSSVPDMPKETMVQESIDTISRSANDLDGSNREPSSVALVDVTSSPKTIAPVGSPSVSRDGKMKHSKSVPSSDEISSPSARATSPVSISSSPSRSKVPTPPASPSLSRVDTPPASPSLSRVDTPPASPSRSKVSTPPASPSHSKVDTTSASPVTRNDPSPVSSPVKETRKASSQEAATTADPSANVSASKDEIVSSTEEPIASTRSSPKSSAAKPTQIVDISDDESEAPAKTSKALPMSSAGRRKLALQNTGQKSSEESAKQRVRAGNNGRGKGGFARRMEKKKVSEAAGEKDDSDEDAEDNRDTEIIKDGPEPTEKASEEDAEDDTRAKKSEKKGSEFSSSDEESESDSEEESDAEEEAESTTTRVQKKSDNSENIEKKRDTDEEDAPKKRKQASPRSVEREHRGLKEGLINAVCAGKRAKMIPSGKSK